MPIIFGPSTESVPNGYSSPANEVIEVLINTGDTVRWGVTGSARGSGGTSGEFGFYLREAGSNVLVAPLSPNWGQAEELSLTATHPIGGLFTLQIGGNAFNEASGTAFGVFVEHTPASTANCAYGTQRKFGVAEFLLLTPDQILTLLSFGSNQFLRTVLGFLDYQMLDVETLCRAGPPLLPPVDLPDPTDSVATWTRVFHAVIWAQLCECVPGTPAAIPFPPYDPVQPPNWVLPPTFPCDPADLCAAIVRIQSQLAALLQTTGGIAELTTLLQRYQLPFAYILGARHSGLSGTGAFQVPRCVGFLVEILDAPPGLQTFTGAPPYIVDLGWVSTLNGNGMVDEVRVTRTAQTWFPAQAQNALTFAFALREGVVASVTELYAEP